MIAYLEGNILASKPTEIILNVNGVGYLVHIPLSTFEQISGGTEARLFIHTAVREESITLFGFYDHVEKEMFELLISITGIGPKSALGILSGIRGDDLRIAVQSGDVNRLVSVPGIGRKTAERIVLELKEKIDRISVDTADTGYQTRNEAVLALTTLGYNQRNAEKAVREILEGAPALELEELLRAALKKLSG